MENTGFDTARSQTKEGEKAMLIQGRGGRNRATHLIKSYPAAHLEPLDGEKAFSDSFLNLSTCFSSPGMVRKEDQRPHGVKVIDGVDCNLPGIFNFWREGRQFSDQRCQITLLRTSYLLVSEP